VTVSDRSDRGADGGTSTGRRVVAGTVQPRRRSRQRVQRRRRRTRRLQLFTQHHWTYVTFINLLPEVIHIRLSSDTALTRLGLPFLRAVIRSCIHSFLYYAIGSSKSIYRKKVKKDKLLTYIIIYLLIFWISHQLEVFHLIMLISQIAVLSVKCLMLGATVFVVLLYFWAPVSAVSLVFLLTPSLCYWLFLRALKWCWHDCVLSDTMR